MKSIFLSLALLGSFSFMSVANEYNVIIFSEEGERFWLVMNGIQQNEKAETNVKVTGLNGEFYKVKVIFEDKGLGTVSKNLAMPEYSAEITAIVKKNKKGEYTLRYFGDVPLAQAPPAAPNQKVIVLSTEPVISQTVTITEQTTTTNNSDDVEVDVNIGGVGMSIDVNVNDGPMHNSNVTTTTTTTSYSETNVVAVEDGGCYAMSSGEFSDARGSINSKTYEDSKLAIAKQITKANCLSAQQVKEVMNLFTYEDSKLEFAKFAYQYTADKNNYYKVHDAFGYETSIEELNEYLGQ